MEELLKLLSVQSYSHKTEDMYNYLLEFSQRNGWKNYKDGLWNLYVVKGEGTSETYPCAVAHTDTVHSFVKGGIHPVVIDGKITGINPLSMRQTGIGGDDKCGIWAALHCLTVLPVCKAAFFVDEESGARGSGGCHLEFFKDCRYILQADRRGNDDFVTDINGRLSSDAFLDAVLPIAKRFGYTKSYGAFTDVMKLRNRDVGISVANMSAGYHNPHSDGEYIVVAELEAVAVMMQTIFTEVVDVFPFTYEPPKYAPVKYTSPTHSYTPPQSPGAGVSYPGARGSHVDENGFRYWSSNGQQITREDRANYWAKHGFVRCMYCDTLTAVTELFQTSPSSVCLTCEIHKEKHGIYPVSEDSNMWRRLAGYNGKRKHKKKKWKGFGSKASNNKDGNIHYEQKDQGSAPQNS